MKELFIILILGVVLSAQAYAQQPAIGSSHEKDLDSLIKCLKNCNNTTREVVAIALGDINDTRAVEPLIQTLKDNDSGVRGAAAEALGRMKDTRAIEPLIRYLIDNQIFAGLGPEYAFIDMGKPAVEPLILALNDEESYVRRTAAEALGGYQ